MKSQAPIPESGAVHWKQKRRPNGGRLRLCTVQSELEPVHDARVHPDVVLVGEAVEPEQHPVELDGTENQLAFSEVQAATKEHRLAAIANPTRGDVRTPEQSVSIR